MSLATVNNGDSAVSARGKINSVVAAVNGLVASSDLVVKRGTGILQAYTTAATTAAPPPFLQFTWGAGVGTFSVLFDGNTYNFTCSITGDPGDGTIFIDTSTSASVSNFTAALNSIPNLTSYISAYPQTFEMSTTLTGSDVNLSIVDGGSGVITSISGGGVGTDDMPNSGETVEVVLDTGSSGRQIGMVRAWFDGAIGGGVNIGLYLRAGGEDTQISSWDTPDHAAEMVFLTGYLDQWTLGQTAGEQLVFKLINGTLPLDSSVCTVGAVWQYN